MGASLWRGWVVAGATLLAGVAFGQAELRIPLGRRHFIVLVDSSASMVARSLPPAAPNTKRKALSTAERELATLLYTPGRVVSGPWFRHGEDIVTVVQYGVDTKPRADLAYLRLKDARLDTDYVRSVVRADAKLSREHFLKAIHPKVHTHLNVLAWALPMGVSEAAVPADTVQQTFVILLNDAQMNDGSMVLEKTTLGMHLNQTARQRLASKEALVENSIRLAGKAGLSNAWLLESFGEGADRVVITAFEALPTTTAATATPLLNLHPLDGLSLDATRSGLTANFDPGPELRGAPAVLKIEAGGKAVSKTMVLSEHCSVDLNSLAGLRAKASLAVLRSAGNPVLGEQRYELVYTEPVLLPAGARSRAILAWAIAFAAVIGGAAWGYFHALLARHFRVWLPGYVTSFELPAISQRVTSRHISRQPTETGDLAAVLTLPSRFIRSIFYRRTTLRWDPKLRLANAPEGVETANLMELPRVTRFFWQDRPSTAGELDLTIERSAKNGRNQRAKINVRFLALPDRSRSTFNRHEP